MADLFSPIVEARRQALRDRGWHEAVGISQGSFYWRRLDGAIIEEEEAFRQLEALEALEAGKAKQ
ncbi:MAG: hypothetical protein KGL39_26960 [Patescibacteria group bacterium]|nr:hypothetical protein [Patescibacteria group bacterium]